LIGRIKPPGRKRKMEPPPSSVSPKHDIISKA
jgi:hypothetical protein